MGFATQVHLLPQTVLDSDLHLKPRQKLQLEILKQGPLYLSIDDLSLWETAFQNTLLDTDDETEVGVLINEIFALAMLNMYGAFDVKRTKDFAELVLEIFNQNGIQVSLSQLETGQVVSSPNKGKPLLGASTHLLARRCPKNY